MNIKQACTTALTLCISIYANADENAIGLYTYNSPTTGSERIAEIKKDGDTYLFIEDVINKTNAIALSKGADGLTYNNMALKLSKDGSSLYFGPINGSRVDNNYLSERLETLAKNQKTCAALQNEVDTQSKAGLTTAEWNEFSQSLKTRTPADCHLIGAGMRW